MRVLGRVERFRNELQVEVRTLEPAEGVDPAELAVGLRRDADELEGFLEFLVAEVHDDGLREVVVRALARGAAPRRIPPRPTGTTRTPAGCSSTRSASRRSAASSARSTRGSVPTC